MKEITLLSHLFIESTDSTPVDSGVATELTKAAQRNRSKVIVGSLFIEREIEAIIGFYLYPGPEVSKKQHFFAGEILGSDAVTFSHKKRLLLSLVNQEEWLKGKAKADFDAELKKVISLRNAFTHGNIVIRQSSAFLEYFEGQKRKVELSDEFLTGVESSFSAVVAHLETIKGEAGVLRSKPDA